MATLTFLDSLLAVATVLAQLAATVLFLEHSDWGRNLSEALQCGVVAGTTVFHVFVLYLVLRWRSRGAGYDPGLFGVVIETYFTMGLFLVVTLGFQENTLEKIWVCALGSISVYGVLDLSRAAHAFRNTTVLDFLLSSAIWKTEGYTTWRVGFGILLVVMIVGRTYRESWLRNAGREAAQVNNVELKKHLPERADEEKLKN